MTDVGIGDHGTQATALVPVVQPAPTPPPPPAKRIRLGTVTRFIANFSASTAKPAAAGCPPRLPPGWLIS